MYKKLTPYWTEIELYISIVLQANGCAFSICGIQPETKKIQLVKTWYSPIVSSEKLKKNLEKYLNWYIKNRYPSDEDVESEKLTKYFHLIFFSKNLKTKNIIKGTKIENGNIEVLTKYCDVKAELKNTLALMLNFINDNKIETSEEIDLEEIKNEILNICLENDLQSPLATSLQYSFGEILYLQNNERVPYIKNSHLRKEINNFHMMTARI